MPINTRKFWLLVIVIGIIYAVGAAKMFAQASAVSYPFAVENAADAVVTVLLAGDGSSSSSGSGQTGHSNGTSRLEIQ